MTLHDSIWLCITLYVFVWLFMTLYEAVRLCKSMYDPVWLCMRLYDTKWLWMTLNASEWLCMTLFVVVWPCMPFYDYVWLCLTLYNSAWLCILVVVSLTDQVWLNVSLYYSVLCMIFLLCVTVGPCLTAFDFLKPIFNKSWCHLTRFDPFPECSKTNIRLRQDSVKNTIRQEWDNTETRQNNVLISGTRSWNIFQTKQD